MNFSQAAKVFQINILRQVGVTVTPDQLGLKSDPIADLQAKNTNLKFGSLLNGLTGSTASASNFTLPVAPTPPTNLDDKEAMLKYQNQLMAYNQASQVYNQRMMQAILAQMQNIQRQVQQNSQSGSSSSSSSSDSSYLGVGGIL